MKLQTKSGDWKKWEAMTIDEKADRIRQVCDHNTRRHDQERHYLELLDQSVQWFCRSFPHLQAFDSSLEFLEFLDLLEGLDHFPIAGLREDV